MRKLLNAIKSFAFWGIMFLLILVLGFGVRFKDIFEIATSFQMPLAAFCIYYLISIILYPLLAVLLCGNISKEIMDNDATTDMFTELPSEFHESALLERFHGFIKGWNIPRMNDDLKVNGWALNSEYFCSIMHELRNDSSYRAIVDRLIEVPDEADTRDTEAVKRIATAYLKLLFPHVRRPEDIRSADFNRYCLRRACKMRSIILTQMGIMDIEYAGKDLPQFKVRSVQ